MIYVWPFLMISLFLSISLSCLCVFSWFSLSRVSFSALSMHHLNVFGRFWRPISNEPPSPVSLDALWVSVTFSACEMRVTPPSLCEAVCLRVTLPLFMKVDGQTAQFCSGTLSSLSPSPHPSGLTHLWRLTLLWTFLSFLWTFHSSVLPLPPCTSALSTTFINLQPDV